MILYVYKMTLHEFFHCPIEQNEYDLKLLDYQNIILHKSIKIKKAGDAYDSLDNGTSYRAQKAINAVLNINVFSLVTPDIVLNTHIQLIK